MKKIDIASLESTLANYKSRVNSPVGQQNKPDNTQTVAQTAVQPDEMATKPQRQPQSKPTAPVIK